MFTPEKRMHPDRAHAFTKAQTSRDGQLRSQGKTKIKEWKYAPGCVVCVLRNSCCYLNFTFVTFPKMQSQIQIQLHRTCYICICVTACSFLNVICFHILLSLSFILKQIPRKMHCRAFLSPNLHFGEALTFMDNFILLAAVSSLLRAQWKTFPLRCPSPFLLPKALLLR